MNFQTELRILINKYCMENGSNTPDFILVDYLNGCLANFNRIINKRDNHKNYSQKTSNKSEDKNE